MTVGSWSRAVKYTTRRATSAIRTSGLLDEGLHVLQDLSRLPLDVPAADGLPVDFPRDLSRDMHESARRGPRRR